MRLLTLTLSALLLTLIATEVSATTDSRQSAGQNYTCRIVTGYGTAIGRGSSKLAAKAHAREICGSKLIDQAFAQRGNLTASAEDAIIESCVNSECQ